VVAASTPDAPTAPTTSIENEFVRIVWNEPSANSAALDGYEVFIAQADGTFLLESTYCDGFTSAAVLADHYCLVPMTVLNGATYGLPLGDIVRAKVRAHNAYGYSAESPVNSAGVSVQTAPAQVQGLVSGSTTSPT
jgi:hypothetical protein